MLPVETIKTIMKYSMQIDKHLILFIFGLVVLLGCEENENPVQSDDIIQPCFTSFSFLKSNNPQLSDDIVLTFENDSTIVGYALGIENVKTLIATFDGSFDLVEVGGGKTKLRENG